LTVKIIANVGSSISSGYSGTGCQNRNAFHDGDAFNAAPIATMVACRDGLRFVPFQAAKRIQLE